jgi:DNA-binding NarL/FixJ family response regulator
VIPFDDLQPNQFRLTPREQECVFWVGLAATNGEIARQMMLNTTNVEDLLHQIYRKLLDVVGVFSCPILQCFIAYST